MEPQWSPRTYEVVHYPIKRVGATYRNMESTMDASLLWKLQQGVAQAKFEVLKTIAREGYVPVNDEGVNFMVEVAAYVEQRAVDGEATDGKWIRVPVDMSHLTVSKF